MQYELDDPQMLDCFLDCGSTLSEIVAELRLCLPNLIDCYAYLDKVGKKTVYNVPEIISHTKQSVNDQHKILDQAYSHLGELKTLLRNLNSGAIQGNSRKVLSGHIQPQLRTIRELRDILCEYLNCGAYSTYHQQCRRLQQLVHRIPFGYSLWNNLVQKASKTDLWSRKCEQVS